MPVEKILLSQEIKDKIKDLVEENEVLDQKEDLISKAKLIKLNFLTSLAKEYQHYLPLHEDFLRWLSYLCVKKAVEDPSAEAYFVKIAENMFGKEDCHDDLRREVRRFQLDPKDFLGECYESYIENFILGYKHVAGRPKNVPIDIVWREIIENKEFPILSRVLRGAMSIFHSTASVEGAVNDTRNVLGDRSHNLLDDNLISRKILKSAIRLC